MRRRIFVEAARSCARCGRFDLAEAWWHASRRSA
jgi:hypothetical protein